MNSIRRQQLKDRRRTLPLIVSIPSGILADSLHTPTETVASLVPSTQPTETSLSGNTDSTLVLQPPTSTSSTSSDTRTETVASLVPSTPPTETSLSGSTDSTLVLQPPTSTSSTSSDTRTETVASLVPSTQPTETSLSGSTDSTLVLQPPTSTSSTSSDTRTETVASLVPSTPPTETSLSGSTDSTVVQQPPTSTPSPSSDSPIETVTPLVPSSSFPDTSPPIDASLPDTATLPTMSASSIAQGSNMDEPSFNFKSVVTMPLPNSWRSISNSTSVRLYTLHIGTDNDAVQFGKTITLKSDLSWKVFLNTKQLPSSCRLLKDIPSTVESPAAVMQLVNVVDNAVPCCGNPDNHFISLVKKRVAVFEAREGVVML